MLVATSQIPTLLLKILMCHEGVKLRVLGFSLQQIPSSETTGTSSDHACQSSGPPRGWHRASTWSSVSTQVMDWAVSPRQPRDPTQVLLGDSWDWSPARRGSLPLKPKASSCPGPPLQPLQRLYYLVSVWSVRNIIHASALCVT